MAGRWGLEALMNFWKRLEAALIEKNISEAELSRRLGLNQASITGWKIHGSIPRADIAVKAAKLLDTTVEWLLEGNKVEVSKSGDNYFLVPVLNQTLSAGNGDLLPETDITQGLVAVPSFLREYGKNIAGLYVHGDSMEPTLKDGDLIVCSSSGWDDGEGLYAVRLNGKGYVKRVQVLAGKLVLMSDNPKYKPIEEPLESDDYSVIGKVLLIIKKAF